MHTAVQLQCSVQQRFAAERIHTFRWINERQSMLIFKVGRYWLANMYVVWMTVMNGKRRKVIHWQIKREITNGWNCDGSCTVTSFPFWAVRVYSFMHLILVTQNVRTRKKILCRSGSQVHIVRHNFQISGGPVVVFISMRLNVLLKIVHNIKTLLLLFSI